MAVCKKVVIRDRVLVWSKYSNAQRVSSLHLFQRLLESAIVVGYVFQFNGRSAMDWKTMLSYISGSVDEELLLRNEYLVGLCLLFIHPRAPNLINLRSAGTMPA